MVTLGLVQFGQAMTAKEIAMFNMDASFKQPMDSDKLHVLLFEAADKLVMQVETSCITAMNHFSRLGYISFFLEKNGFWLRWGHGMG